MSASWTPRLVVTRRASGSIAVSLSDKSVASSRPPNPAPRTTMRASATSGVDEAGHLDAGRHTSSLLRAAELLVVRPGDLDAVAAAGLRTVHGEVGTVHQLAGPSRV